MSINTIDTAVALSTDEDREWGEKLRATLDGYGVSDAERTAAVLKLIELGREVLACTTLDGAEFAVEAVACALDQTFEVATTLATQLNEIATTREP